MKKKKVFLLYFIIILVLGFAIFFSYAFFLTKIEGNDTAKISNYSSMPLSITYSGGTNEISSGNLQSFTPGDSFNKTFTVTNDSDQAFNFKMSLTNVVNTFTRKEDIKYTLKLGNDVIKTDIYPSNDIVLVASKKILSGETLSYTLIIEYLNTGENQIVDNGATISGIISFDYGEDFIIYGNSIQNGTPTLGNPIEIDSVGDLSQYSKLPSGYTELEYIEATGNQYIDTGIYSNKGKKIYVDFQLTQKVSQGRIFGADFDQSTGITGFSNSLYQNGSGIFSYSYKDDNGNWIQTGRSTDTNRHTFLMDGPNETVSFDNGVYTGSLSSYSATKTAVNTLTIFADNRTVNSQPISYYAKMVLYTFKIWDSGTLIRDFVPAKNSNDVVGLYDIVNNVFYTSPNGNNFKGGAEIHYYDVPITVNGNNYTISLRSPLRKVGDVADYIDYAEGSVIRNINHIELPTSRMNASESYPGWKNIPETFLLASYYPSNNTRLKNNTSVISNVGENVWAAFINTNSTNNILFFSGIGLTQTDIMSNYPSLVYKLDYVSPNPTNEPIENLPNIVLNKGYNEISVNTTVEPSNIE